MATPTTNSVGITNVSTSDMPALIYGTKWGLWLGWGVTLEYSFNSAGNSYYLSSYSDYQEPFNWYVLNSSEQNSIRLAIDIISDMINVNFVEVNDTPTFNGDIRFGGTFGHPTGAYAHAYYPWTTPQAGDVWFSEDWNWDRGAVTPGTYDFKTILHEIGHALGLKHPFEGAATLPTDEDNYFYTVMSYTASPWSNGSNVADFYPTTLMYYDLVALQSLYGRRAGHNGGDTTYTFRDGEYYFQTIDDTGGSDTIKYVGTQGCQISLTTGHFSMLSESIGFWNGFDYTYSRDSVCIGPKTIIENGIGGSGNDEIIGNSIANKLTGNGGNDRMIGGAGNDTLYGGADHDTLTGGSGSDKFILSSIKAASSDTITDFTRNTDTIQLENGVLTGLGAAALNLAASKFWIGAGAHDATDRIIYNRASGNLYYDANGSGAGGSVLIAKLDSGLNLSASDFQVI